MRALALAAIRGYQRFLSPLKGFSCAFRVATSAESCSAYGYRVIERFGLRRGLGLLDRRLALCGHVHRRALATRGPARPRVRHPLLHRQRGDCDLPCDASCCDFHHSGGCVTDLLNSCSACGDCSWSRSTGDAALEKEQRHLQAITERAERRRAQERQRKKQKPVE
jgi:putative component of membrane protein insertase Oxa1/YidC/SpoIIIJ protein YidD